MTNKFPFFAISFLLILLFAMSVLAIGVMPAVEKIDYKEEVSISSNSIITYTVYNEQRQNLAISVGKEGDFSSAVKIEPEHFETDDKFSYFNVLLDFNGQQPPKGAKSSNITLLLNFRNLDTGKNFKIKSIIVIDNINETSASSVQEKKEANKKASLTGFAGSEETKNRFYNSNLFGLVLFAGILIAVNLLMLYNWQKSPVVASKRTQSSITQLNPLELQRLISLADWLMAIDQQTFSKYVNKDRNDIALIIDEKFNNPSLALRVFNVYNKEEMSRIIRQALGNR